MARPLSPHLGIYRLTMTMLMSIAHRISGLILYGALLGAIGWLLLLAFSPPYFALAQTWLSSVWGQMVLFAALWSFCHHLFGGLRHFLWDLGYGLGVYGREWLAWGTLVLGLLVALVLFLGPGYEFNLGGIL